MKVPEVPIVAIGSKCEVYQDQECRTTDEGRKYTRCARESGRQHSRCQCVPGYASNYNSLVFHCQGR